MAEEQEVESFDELIKLIRGMCGQIVEAGIFLPWDDGKFHVASFSGRLREVALWDKSPSPRWVLSWGDEPNAMEPMAAIWERRFVRAELSFTGSPEDGRTEDGLEVDETMGHNIFLKVYSEGWILDLTSYVGA